MRPVQRRINARFERAATERLAAIDPLVVGITGSYGKTTTKVCIGAVLSSQVRTLITPASFNSRLGVVRAINEHLEPSHEAFVVEMGMYRKGDITELCELVHPRIGVLTAIGPMHLERLGSIEAIADAKAELARALPKDGHLVANGDDPRVRAIASQVEAETVLYGLECKDATVTAEEIALADGRTQFTLVIDDDSRAACLGRAARPPQRLEPVGCRGRRASLRDPDRADRGRARRGDTARAPAAADRQPARRDHRDRRRLQLQPGRRRCRA